MRGLDQGTSQAVGDKSGRKERAGAASTGFAPCALTRDVDEREVVELARGEDALKLAGGDTLELSEEGDAWIGRVHPRGVNDGETLGAGDLKEHGVGPVVVQHRDL